MDRSTLENYIKEILKQKKVKEGTCGYDRDAKSGKKFSTPGGMPLKRKDESLTPNELGDLQRGDSMDNIDPEVVAEEEEEFKHEGESCDEAHPGLTHEEWEFEQSKKDSPKFWRDIWKVQKESVSEGLSPETAAKAEKIKSTMIGKNRDKLFKAYGKDAEKVAHGRAINQAKKAAEKEVTENHDCEKVHPGMTHDEWLDQMTKDQIDHDRETLRRERGLEEETVNEQMDIYDDIANEEFGMDYDQLGSNEKEWVRDEIDNMSINETITKKMWQEDWKLKGIYGKEFDDHVESRTKALIKLGVKPEKAEDWSMNNWDTLPGSVMKLLQEVYSEKQRKWACAQKSPKFDEMCKDTAISKKKNMKENRLTELIKTALKRPVGEHKVSQDNPPTNTKDRAEWDKREIGRGKRWDKSEAERLKKLDVKEECCGVEEKIREIVRKKLGKVPSPNKMMSKRKMKTPSGVGFSMDYELNENFGGDALEHGSWYDIKDLGDGEIREDFEYIGFDRNEQEHVFVSHDVGGDTFMKVLDEEVEDLVIFPMQGTMRDPYPGELDEAKDWIQKAIKRPGALHRELGVPKDKDIPKGKINKAISRLKKKDKDDKEKGTQLSKGDERELRQLNLAKTLSKFNEGKLKEDDKDWIQKAIKRPGALRKKLGVKKGKDIPKGKINKAISKLKKKDKDDKEKGTQLSKGDERELKQLTLAKTLSKFKK